MRELPRQLGAICQLVACRRVDTICRRAAGLLADGVPRFGEMGPERLARWLGAPRFHEEITRPDPDLRRKRGQQEFRSWKPSRSYSRSLLVVCPSEGHDVSTSTNGAL